jgi:hypothetical protein
VPFGQQAFHGEPANAATGPENDDFHVMFPFLANQLDTM